MDILCRAGGWSNAPCICAESVCCAVLNCHHFPCVCEGKSRYSEGVFRQLYADAWSRDHDRGHGAEMEFRRRQVE